MSVFKVVHQNVSREDRQDPSKSQSDDTTSTAFEKSGGIFEESVSDREEFTVDHGGNAAETDSENSGRALEENESHQEKDDENDRS